MTRDAKGRFCKAEGKKTTKAVNNAAKARYLSDLSDLLSDILKAFAKEGILVGSVECIATTDDTANKAAEFDKISRCESPCTEAEVGCIKAAINLAVLDKLFSAKQKMNKNPKEKKPQGTPIDWMYADPMWVEDLHNIYKDDRIPATEEELRGDILDVMAAAYALIGGFMLYLENKPKVKACTCKSKQGK